MTICFSSPLQRAELQKGCWPLPDKWPHGAASQGLQHCQDGKDIAGGKKCQKISQNAEMHPEMLKITHKK